MSLLRAWLAFAVFGSAVAFAWRGDWAQALLAAAVVLAPAAGSVSRELTATAAMLREVPPPEPEPALCPEREPEHPPWLTAPMPAIGHAESCPAMASMMADGLCRCGVRTAARERMP